MKKPLVVFLILCLILSIAYVTIFYDKLKPNTAKILQPETSKNPSAVISVKPITNESVNKLIKGAKAQISITKKYDPTYQRIQYPNGDVPSDRGACSDVIVRAFRAADTDLQKLVHEDMATHFKAYPNKWSLKKADSNIDHRRVQNLQTFFTRQGKSLVINYRRNDYLPGDIVSWDLNGYGLAHIGLVSDVWSEVNQRYLIIHNIGAGTQLEDRLFDWRITGHYRYF